MDSRKTHINDLPYEMLWHIFGFAPSLTDRRVLSLVCRQWNDVAFDYCYLGRIKLRWPIELDDLPKPLLRSYRNVVIDHTPDFIETEDNEKILTSFKKPSSSLEEFVCCNTVDFLIKLLSTCLRVEKLELMCEEARTFRIGSFPKLPILESLTEIVIGFKVPKRFNVIRLAPNLRKLRALSYLYNLPRIIQTLPLEHLQVGRCLPEHTDIFGECTEPTKLTAVDVRFTHVNLEQLCRFCPLLTKLRIRPNTSSIRSLASLTYLKVLTLDYRRLDPSSSTTEHVVLPSVEMLEIETFGDMPFDISLEHFFPNVHYLKIACLLDVPATSNIHVRSSKLRILEIHHCNTTALLDVLAGLCNLHTLILCRMQVSASHLPPIGGLQQLTLINSALEVTDEMATNFPRLQFLNVYHWSRVTEAEKLPSRCTVRHYPKIFGKNFFEL